MSCHCDFATRPMLATAVAIVISLALAAAAPTPSDNYQPGLPLSPEELAQLRTKPAHVGRCVRTGIAPFSD